jgi:hypothetical protein
MSLESRMSQSLLMSAETIFQPSARDCGAADGVGRRWGRGA